MKVFKVENFRDFNSASKLAKFINEHHIKKEDIVIINGQGAGYTLFYYAEEDEDVEYLEG